MYLGLTVTSPTVIDWLQIQYYNQGPVCYSDYTGVFVQSSSNGCWSLGTSVAEIAGYGIPLHAIVVGKPVRSVAG